MWYHITAVPELKSPKEDLKFKDNLEWAYWDSVLEKIFFFVIDSSMEI